MFNELWQIGEVQTDIWKETQSFWGRSSKESTWESELYDPP